MNLKLETKSFKKSELLPFETTNRGNPKMYAMSGIFGECLGKLSQKSL